jgi:hypothetical protein
VRRSTPGPQRSTPGPQRSTPGPHKSTPGPREVPTRRRGVTPRVRRSTRGPQRSTRCPHTSTPGPHSSTPGPHRSTRGPREVPTRRRRVHTEGAKVSENLRYRSRTAPEGPVHLVVGDPASLFHQVRGGVDMRSFSQTKARCVAGQGRGRGVKQVY